MKRSFPRTETGTTLVVTICVVATILALLGSAVEYTSHVSRVADRTRKTAVALEIADGHLEYLFASWRNIYRKTWTTYSSDATASGGTDYSCVGTNYFYTVLSKIGPSPTPVPHMNPSATPAPIPTPAPVNFPTSEYTVTQYRIQGVDPMITLDSKKVYGTDPEQALKETSFGSGTIDSAGNPISGFTPIPKDQIPPFAYGPNSWQYSLFYLAAVDVTIQTLTGPVTAKVRRVFEKRFDNPWTYAMFYVDDLEFNPSYAMTINGPVHTNGNLYIGNSNFSTTDRIAVGGTYVNGYAPRDAQHSGTVTSPNFGALPPSQVAPMLPFGWNLNLSTADGNANTDSYHEIIERPAAGSDPLAAVRLYNQAGIRVLIDKNNNLTFYNAAGNVVSTSSSGNDKVIAQTLGSALTKNVALWDARENTYVRTTIFDVGVFTTAINNGSITGFNGVIYIADTATHGEKINSKLGGTSNTVETSERAIRLVNGAVLPTGSTSKNNAAGLTVVSENPVYVQGNYNTGTGTIPSNALDAYSNPSATPSPQSSGYDRKGAAIIADSINILSTAWSDLASASATGSRVATSTTINAALIGGTVPSGTSGGNYSGGGENFVRFLEDWSQNLAQFTYYGSMMQMFSSKQGTGLWNGNGTVYKSPGNRWFYDDVKFSNMSSTPPGKMILAAYLQQQRWYQVY